MDQGHSSSAKAKTALSREWETDIKYSTTEIISLNGICVKCYEGEIPRTLHSFIQYVLYIR